jgi:tetratricopeptide (TPR) repeat protein
MIWLLALQLAAGPVQHYEKAKQDFAQRKFDEAVSEVDTALHESPNMVPALVLKARFYYNQNNFHMAISPLQTAQTLSPQSPLPVFYLAMAHEAIGDATQASDLYQRAENLSPEKSPQSAEILVAYGRFLLTLGRTQDGIEKIRRAIQVDPESREAHYEWAKELDIEGDFKNAALEAERALTLPELSIKDAQIHFLLAKLYMALKQPDLAKAHREKFEAAQQTSLK